MSQKDSLSKLRNFFRMDKNASGYSREKTDADLLRELEGLLQPQIATAQRCRTLKELCESDKINRLEDATIINLWELTKDLITATRPVDHRHITYRFYQKLVQCQYEDLSLMRVHFFRVIQGNDNLEDLQCQLDLLKTLTDNGKNIKDIDDVIGDFILNRWLIKISDSKQIKDILNMVHNIIVYNAAYLDPNVVEGIITYACFMCSTPDDIVLQCLDVLDALLCYTVLPNKMLPEWVNALCRTVNREKYVQKSWDIMKKLLGTKMGHAALLYMCNLLNNSNNVNDDALLRGAVFYINMGLWGSTCSKANDLFKQSPTSVLQSFLFALKSQRAIVTYEVIIGIQRLIHVSGRDLSEPTWDVLCEILRTIADNIHYYETNEALEKGSVIQHAYHEALDKIELLLQRHEAATDPQTIYSVIEYVCETRSEESIISLMEYKATKITPTQTQWLHELNTFMVRFFNMQNPNIRDKSLHVLKRVMDNNRSAYEEEILESIVIPTFANIAHENDAKIRTSVGELLLKFVAQCDTKRSIELLDIVEKLLNRPFERFSDENRIVLKNDDELTHITIIINELIRVFLSKLYTLPPSHAMKIFSMLNAHLERYYQKPVLLETSVPIRSSIFAWMLRLRSNANYYLGYIDDIKSNRTRFSHFLNIDTNESNYHQSQRQQQTQAPALTQQSSIDGEAPTTIPIKRSCKIIIDCLMTENDWSVMQLVLKGLPLILQNKALFRGVEMETLAAAIISLVAKSQHPNKSRIDAFISTTPKPQLSDFQALVINSIAALTPYHQQLSTQTQNRMITCLRPGLLALENTPRVCIQAFTVMLMEILELMLRQLAEILFDMSRMSTTLNVAVPVLEFLSTLSRLPCRLFANFTTTQYMYVFAIALPYTNPHKYDHYTVSLAHHVIAGWFLKCKLSCRRQFVLYILKGFATNVQKPFEEMKRNDYAPINEDSSNRKRSSSLTERGAKQRERPSLQNLQMKNEEATDEVAYNFHMELADTCIDFLSRHTYSTCSALPKRSSTAEYLLANGHTMSWLVGNNIVTITTSGCSSTAVRNGLCDRCILVCKSARSTEQTPSNGATSPEVSSLKSGSGSELCKRYTKASFQHNSGEISESSEFVSSNSSSITTPFGMNSDQQKFFKSTSNETRFSNSSGSLDALSRRGSNPDTLDHSSDTVSKHGSISHPIYLSPQQSIERFKQVCICACSGWAEVVIRRPTGNMSWIMKIQNHIALDSLACDVPLQDLINMCTPSLGEVYNIQDLLNEEQQLWSGNVNITNEQMATAEATKRKSVTVETSNNTKSTEVTEKKPENAQSPQNLQASANPTQTTENVASATAATESSSMISHPPSGPINIPKPAHTEKVPSGSFSDIEPEDDDGNGVAFDENESKSRNPVRRVNSSPEMSSNWRHPFIGQKPNQIVQATNVNLPTHVAGDDDFNVTTDVDQQQKKKNLRPSCEAIPEEISDATPPKSSQINQQRPKIEGTISVVASGMAKNQHNDFMAKSSSTKNAQTSSADTLTPFNQNSSIPRKQHSAEDTLPQREQAQSRQQQQQQQQQPPMNEPRHSSSGSAINIGASTNKIKLNIDMPNLATKPPQSHAPLSPRLIARNNIEMSNLNSSNNFNDFQRGRSKTISVVRGEHDKQRDNSKWTFKGTRSVLSPSSIFLQLFYTGSQRVTEQPLLISQKNTRAIDMINYIPPFETHKIGVLYVGRGQTHNEVEILSNRYGSMRYMDFIQNLGALVSLKNAKELNLFIDMETDGRDGNFTYVWQDDIIQVTFHVATLMPNKDHDPNRTEKKKNIGNDYVTIVYNESGEEYNLNTIKGQFNYACVIVEPLELNSNRIFIRCKDDVSKFICHTEPKIISDASAPGYARQLALHANLASLVAKSLQTKNARPYASNWLERLRQIKHLRAKLLKEKGAETSSSNQAVNNSAKNEREIEDFTQYT